MIIAFINQVIMIFLDFHYLVKTSIPMVGQFSITAKTFIFRYYLSLASCLYLCMYECMLFPLIHTVQPTATKLWHNIPHVTI